MDVVAEFKKMNELSVIVRSHEPVDEGVGYLGPDRDVVTVFSAPNYRGGDNDGAVMHVAKDGSYTITLLHGSRAAPAINQKPSCEAPAQPVPQGVCACTGQQQCCES